MFHIKVGLKLYETEIVAALFLLAALILSPYMVEDTHHAPGIEESPITVQEGENPSFLFPSETQNPNGVNESEPPTDVDTKLPVVDKEKDKDRKKPTTQPASPPPVDTTDTSGIATYTTDIQVTETTETFDIVYELKITRGIVPFTYGANPAIRYTLTNGEAVVLENTIPLTPEDSQLFLVKGESQRIAFTLEKDQTDFTPGTYLLTVYHPSQELANQTTAISIHFPWVEKK